MEVIHKQGLGGYSLNEHAVMRISVYTAAFWQLHPQDRISKQVPKKKKKTENQEHAKTKKEMKFKKTKNIVCPLHLQKKKKDSRSLHISLLNIGLQQSSSKWLSTPQQTKEEGLKQMTTIFTQTSPNWAQLSHTAVVRD